MSNGAYGCSRKRACGERVAAVLAGTWFEFGTIKVPTPANDSTPPQATPAGEPSLGDFIVNVSERRGCDVVFDYYKRLSAAKQSVYRQSDAIVAIGLPDAEVLRPSALALLEALKSENRTTVQRLSQQVTDGIVGQLRVPPLRIQVLAVRPSADWGELHGLYLPEEDGNKAKIQLWMRTAKHKRVVAFRSYLRTLLHEVCHHLDYEFYQFPETFHTEGFYNRESSLFHQLVPGGQMNPPPLET